MTWTCWYRYAGDRMTYKHVEAGRPAMLRWIRAQPHIVIQSVRDEEGNKVDTSQIMAVRLSQHKRKKGNHLPKEKGNHLLKDFLARVCGTNTAMRPASLKTQSTSADHQDGVIPFRSMTSHRG